MKEQRVIAGPIHSTFSEEGEMRALIRIFLDELPERVDQLESAWREGDSERVARIAHQLKGACTGYGYEPLTAAAAELEEAIVDAGQELDAVNREFRMLIDLCTRAVL